MVYITPDLTRKQQEVDKDPRRKVKHLRKNGKPSVRIKAGKVANNGEEGGVVVVYEPMK